VIEPVRMLADALADADHGVTAQLALLHDGGYFDVGDVIPTTVVVVDETRDAAAALGRAGERNAEYMVMVMLVGIDVADPNAAVQHRQFLATMGVAVTATSDQAAERLQDVGYILRAVMRSVQWFFRDAGEAHRVRNGVQFIAATSASLAHFQLSSTSDQTSAGYKVQAEFVDALPD
jgi:hypothetical protein